MPIDPNRDRRASQRVGGSGDAFSGRDDRIPGRGGRPEDDARDDDDDDDDNDRRRVERDKPERRIPNRNQSGADDTGSSGSDSGGSPDANQGLETGSDAFSDSTISDARELERWAVDAFGGSESDYRVTAGNDGLSVRFTESGRRNVANRRDITATRLTVGSITRNREDPTAADDSNIQTTRDTVGSITRNRENPTGNDDTFRPTIFSGPTPDSSGQVMPSSPSSSGSIDRQRSESQSPGEFFSSVASDVVSDPLGAVRGFRSWQSRTNPLRDFAAQNRERIGAPAPGAETASAFAQNPTGFTFGTPTEGSLTESQDERATDVITGIQEGRLRLRSDILSGAQSLTGSGETAAAATAFALAEPTPVGEAVLLGAGAVGIAGSATASGTSQGEQRIPSSPFAPGSSSEVQVPEDGGVTSQSEVNVPSDGSPVVDAELGVPDVGGINRPELQPSESPEFGSPEIAVPDRPVGDLLTVSTSQLFREGRQRQRERDRASERFRERTGADSDELQNILSGGGTLGEMEPEVSQPEVTEPEITDPSVDFREGDFGVRDPPRLDTPDAQSQAEQPSLDVAQTPSLGTGFGSGIGQPLISPVGQTAEQPRQDENVRADPFEIPNVDIGQPTDVAQPTDTGVDFGFSTPTATPNTPALSTETVTEQAEPNNPGFGFGTPSSRRRRPRFDFGLDADDAEDTFGFGGTEGQFTFNTADLGFGGNGDSPVSEDWF
ncbi:hypothetical protein [Halogeometricum luteum]|uniref:Uncharacterized protein n=1 Tax=Halogeometricum luteum TaxID=2950537 RepID=A0ABU2G8G8_9EURY|nr:hypothetical protein [Halogeometricum sp. S3BR5-2]MDS0297108.1 hypothetical protein [Halogeometricum sp. S3BR5-2]